MTEYNDIPKPSFSEDFGTLILAIVAVPLVIGAVLGLPVALGLLFTSMSAQTFGLVACMGAVVMAVTAIGTFSEQHRKRVEADNARAD